MFPIFRLINWQFIRGNWDIEAYVKNEKLGPNLKLKFLKDTTVIYVIETCKDRVE